MVRSAILVQCQLGFLS